MHYEVVESGDDHGWWRYHLANTDGRAPCGVKRTAAANDDEQAEALRLLLGGIQADATWCQPCRATLADWTNPPADDPDAWRERFAEANALDAALPSGGHPVADGPRAQQRRAVVDADRLPDLADLERDVADLVSERVTRRAALAQVAKDDTAEVERVRAATEPDLRWHLTANVNPPVEDMYGAAVEAIAAVVADDPDRPVGVRPAERP